MRWLLLVASIPSSVGWWAYGGRCRPRRRFQPEKRRALPQHARVRERGVHVLLSMLMVILAGCGGTSGGGRRAAPSTSSSVPAGGATIPSTSVPAPTTTTAPGGLPAPAGGPVPAGFSPVSVTAVSTTTFWVLGTAPCQSPPCTSLVRTTDGGRHFLGLPAPRVPLVGVDQPGSQAPSDAVSGLRFADGQDGWAFGPALYATHDGGGSWHLLSVPGQVIDLAAAAGQVWVLGGDCQVGEGCSSFWLERSPVSRDDFTPVSLPVPMTGPAPTPALAVQGAAVYLLDNSVSTGQGYHSTLLVSADGGGRFARYQSPCTVDLGGRLSATTTSLWSVCPTGMMSGLWRSVDGGVSFGKVQTPVPTPNSATVAAAGDSGAVLGFVEPRLYMTADGGRTWVQGKVPANLTRSGGAVFYLGMSDVSVGFALLSAPTGQTETLLRTTDGGLDWAVVSF